MKTINEIMDSEAYIIEYTNPTRFQHLNGNKWYRVIATAYKSDYHLSFMEIACDYANITEECPTRVLARIDTKNLTVQVYDVPVGNAAYEDFYLNSLTRQEHFWLNRINTLNVAYDEHINMKEADAFAVKTLLNRNYVIDGLGGVDITVKGQLFVMYRDQILNRQLNEMEKDEDGSN